MKCSCDVILDLIPLVKDGVASQDSRDLVLHHVEICQSCKEEFENYNPNALNKIDDRKIISSIKKNIFIMGLILLAIGSMIGVALSNSSSMFYNFIIMPVIGVLGYLILKTKWYFALVGMFGLSYVWLVTSGIVQDGFAIEVFHYSIYLSGIYTFLVFLGVVIAKLLGFAFNKNKKILRAVAGIVAFLLIGIILFVTNAFVGNPITAKIADNAIKRYVENEYPFLNLEVEKSRYNFKNISYVAKAKSKTNIDIHFNIYYREGKVQRDDYDSYVLGMFNTLQRLSEEYSNLARALIANELGFKNNSTMVMYDKDEYGHAEEILKLGMPFDRSLPLKSEVTIRLDLPDNSIESIAKILTNAHRVFIDNGCNFSKYGLYAENNDMLIMVDNVTPRDIESGQLINLLEQAKNEDNMDGISVYIKEGNK